LVPIAISATRFSNGKLTVAAERSETSSLREHRYFWSMAEDAVFTETEPPEERAFDHARTVALSDGVFAIALTLLVLNITVPALGPLQHNKLGAGLLHRAGQFESYALSFAVLALMWVRHHGLFRALDRIDLNVTLLNLIYLGFVAFLPYPTRVLSQYGNEPASIVLYASTIAIVTTIAGLTRVYVQRAHLLSEAGARELAGRQYWAIAPAIFVASIGVAYVSPTAAKLTWLLLAVPGLRRAQTARRG
jgi:uncharacterized membrane protein